jgi:hypothetical protein
MTVTIQIDVPRQALGSELTEALAARGLQAELVDGDESCALHVQFASEERDRLIDEAVHAIELHLGELELPLVVQRADGGVVVRPAAD